MSTIIGETIGNCRLEELVGSGGMGQVYRARHVFLGRVQAIKLLNANLEASPELRASFLQEAHLSAVLDHPHIVRVYDCGEWRGRGYMVQEYLAGSSLAALIARSTHVGRALSVGLGLDLARQAAEGLAYAHRHGVVHGDVTPANMLLQRDESYPSQLALKLGDFGLARLSGQLLADDARGGTPLYFAPEQCQGLPATPATDIYALGMALYETLTGQPACVAASYAEMVMRKLSSQPVAPRQFRPDLPAPVEALILRCLSRAPQERPTSAAALAQQLAHLYERLATRAVS